MMCARREPLVWRLLFVESYAAGVKPCAYSTAVSVILDNTAVASPLCFFSVYDM